MESVCGKSLRFRPIMLCLPVAILALLTLPASASKRPAKVVDGKLRLTRAAYLDRVQAIWTAQMIAQMTGGVYEHQTASVVSPVPFVTAKGYAPVDDDYYYEMVAIRAFEKYGPSLTVEQLGEQWLAN